MFYIDAVLQAQQSATAKYEAERVQWLNHQQALELEVHELRSKLSQDRYFVCSFGHSMLNWCI